MAASSSPWYSPFDPPDPDREEAAAVGVAAKRRALLQQTHLDPQDRVSGGFGAVDLIDRTGPGYPGAFLYSGSAFDPTERKVLGVPLDEGGYFPSEGRQPSIEDQFNPLSKGLGIRDVALPEERQLLGIKTPMEAYNDRLRKRRESKAGK